MSLLCVVRPETAPVMNRILPINFQYGELIKQMRGSKRDGRFIVRAVPKDIYFLCHGRYFHDHSQSSNFTGRKDLMLFVWYMLCGSLQHPLNCFISNWNLV